MNKNTKKKTDATKSKKTVAKDITKEYAKAHGGKYGGLPPSATRKPKKNEVPDA